jgi:hypothetical protein
MRFDVKVKIYLLLRLINRHAMTIYGRLDV